MNNDKIGTRLSRKLVCPENANFRFMFCDIAECCSVTLHAHGERTEMYQNGR